MSNPVGYKGRIEAKVCAMGQSYNVPLSCAACHGKANVVFAVVFGSVAGSTTYILTSGANNPVESYTGCWYLVTFTDHHIRIFAGLNFSRIEIMSLRLF